jgi:hypothetical protein
LSELIALKVMSGRARDDADVVELLKRHRSRMVGSGSSALKKPFHPGPWPLFGLGPSRL